MKVTIEHSFCPYCDEVTELYFRIINTILFSGNEAELRESMRQLEKKNSTWWIFHIRLRCTTPLGLPATSQRQNQNIRASYYDGWISMTPWTNIIDWLEWNHPFQPYFHFPFITFSFGCATPFCRNQPFAQSELETTLWKVWFFLPFFLPVPFFFRCGYHYPPRMGYLRFCPLLADTFLMQWPFFWLDGILFVTVSIQARHVSLWLCYSSLTFGRMSRLCADIWICSFSLSLPVYLFPIFHNRFLSKQSSFFLCKDSMPTGTTWLSWPMA